MLYNGAPMLQLVLLAALSAWSPPAAAAEPGAPEPLQLSLKAAVDMALASSENYDFQITRQALALADSDRRQARAALLPEVNGEAAVQRQKLNLAGLGIVGNTSNVLPETTLTTQRDFRVKGQADLFNLQSIARFRAAGRSLLSAEGDVEHAGDQIAYRVGVLYSRAVRAEVLGRSAQENVRRSSAFVGKAERRAAQGKGTNLDVTRAKLQLADGRQRVLSAEVEANRARFELVSLLGLDLGRSFLVFTDAVSTAAFQDSPVEEGLPQAAASRADLRAQTLRVEAARLSERSEFYAAMPILSYYGDYGRNAADQQTPQDTYTFGAKVKLPLVKGGERRAKHDQALANLRREEMRLGALRRQSDLDLRESADSLRLARMQLDAAEDSLALALDELAQARRRYDAGVTSNLDVIDAEGRLANAQERKADALFGLRRAGLEFWLAMGTIRTMIRGAAASAGQ